VRPRVGQRQSLEGFPSGQWEQAVNLPAFAFVGSNPTPSTSITASQSDRTSQSYTGPELTKQTIMRSTRPPVSAGVAQLVERQPSKLNVASSSLVSRSVFLGVGAPEPQLASVGLGARRPKPLRTTTGAPEPQLASVGLGARRPTVFSVRGARRPRTLRTTMGARRLGGRSRSAVALPIFSTNRFAHLAQLVEHVLGKDEVTSSILVVGSKMVFGPVTAERCRLGRLAREGATSLTQLTVLGVGAPPPQLN
jgi:hypothetical protein